MLHGVNFIMRRPACGRRANHDQSGERDAECRLRAINEQTGLLGRAVSGDGFLHAILPNKQRMAVEQAGVEGELRGQRRCDLRRINRVLCNAFAFGFTQHYSEAVERQCQ